MYPYDAFECSTYKLAGQKRSAACCGHHISTKALRELILDTIRTVSTFAISNQEVFMEKVRSASQLRQAEAAKDAKRKLSKDKKRIAELDTIIKKLYESFAVGRITGERFDSLLAEYEAEQKALTASVSKMETQMSAFAEDTARVEQFLELARKYTDFSELTTPMINEFIEKIIVHVPERIDGDRVQEVEIHLRFIGQFELPAPELTEEEIKRQEQLKRHRIKSRERYQKIKAGEHAAGQPFTLTCKSKERKSLLAEKKETPFYHIPKQHELSCRIAELTEELEELKSEKDMLLHSLECSDDAGIAAVKKDISTIEAALKKLAQQEEKYTAELNDALRQYADFKEQAAEFDPDELQDARLALRPVMERSAVDRVQSAYGNKYDPLMMYDSKRDVADLLNRHEKKKSVQKLLRQQQTTQLSRRRNEKQQER